MKLSKDKLPLLVALIAIGAMLLWLGYVQAQQCPHGCAVATPFCNIKGNIVNGKKIYHTRSDPYYNQTIVNSARGEFYFCTEEEARQNGFRAALRP